MTTLLTNPFLRNRIEAKRPQALELIRMMSGIMQCQLGETKCHDPCLPENTHTHTPEVVIPCHYLGGLNWVPAPGFHLTQSALIRVFVHQSTDVGDLFVFCCLIFK